MPPGSAVPTSLYGRSLRLLPSSTPRYLGCRPLRPRLRGRRSPGCRTRAAPARGASGFGTDGGEAGEAHLPEPGHSARPPPSDSVGGAGAGTGVGRRGPCPGPGHLGGAASLRSASVPRGTRLPCAFSSSVNSDRTGYSGTEQMPATRSLPEVPPQRDEISRKCFHPDLSLAQLCAGPSGPCSFYCSSGLREGVPHPDVWKVRVLQSGAPRAREGLSMLLTAAKKPHMISHSLKLGLLSEDEKYFKYSQIS